MKECQKTLEIADRIYGNHLITKCKLRNQKFRYERVCDSCFPNIRIIVQQQKFYRKIDNLLWKASHCDIIETFNRHILEHVNLWAVIMHMKKKMDLQHKKQTTQFITH